jgi:hypothetical protein
MPLISSSASAMEGLTAIYPIRSPGKESDLLKELITAELGNIFNMDGTGLLL